MTGSIIPYARSQMGSFLSFSAGLFDDPGIVPDNCKILCCLHITKETGVFVLELARLGFDVTVVASNPLSTNIQVRNELEAQGIKVLAMNENDSVKLESLITQALECQPDYIVDDGGDLTRIAHTYKCGSILGCCEETTSGVIQIRNLHQDIGLNFPVIAVNNARTKELMDNHFGTGQSIIDGILQSTQGMLAGKNIVVCGYGHCGSGIAKRMKGMGAKVSVTEIDPVKALQAHYDGMTVSALGDLAPIADIIVTATASIDVVDEDVLLKVRDGCILANAGHSNTEINIDHLERLSSSVTIVNDNVDRYELPGKDVFLLGKGRIINLIAANGHPSEVMALSYSSQLAGLHLLLTSTLDPGLHSLLPDYEQRIASNHLNWVGGKLTALTEGQSAYLNGSIGSCESQDRPLLTAAHSGRL